MLELLLMLGVLACLASALSAKPRRRKRSQSKPLAAAPRPRPGEAPRAALRLAINGTRAGRIFETSSS